MFQKLFSMFFAYIIGFQLVVGAIPHHALNSSAWANSCSSGLQWNEMLGRCVTTAQAAELADASKMCESKGDDAAKKQCYRDVIDGKMKDAGVAAPGQIKTSMISVILAMASLLASVMFLATGGPAKCKGVATSAYLIAGSAMAVVAGEIMSASTYKKKLKEAEEKFKAISNSASTDKKSGSTSDNTKATSAQAEAFQAMIELEEATISAAKTKNMLYMVATAGYAGAAVMAGIEMFNPTGGVCIGDAGYSSLGVESLYANTQNNQHVKTVAEVYVDNYFLKKQRVSYASYLNFSSLESSRDSFELSFNNREIMQLRAGQNQSDVEMELYKSASPHREVITKNESAEEFSLMKLASVVAQQFIIPTSSAQIGAITISAASAIAKAAGPAAAAATTSSATGFQKLFAKPVTRLALAGIMTVNNIFMISKTNKEKKKAEERKKFIENLKAQVEAAGAEFGCASGDRNDLSKPNCYCYSEGGGLNPGRVNSATCKNLFGAKPLLASDKSKNPTAVSNQKNCVSSRGELDSSCSCRTSNTCVTVKSPSVIGNVPAGNVLGNLPQTLNGLNNGSLSAADIDGAQFGSLAARLNKLNEKLLSDPKNKALAVQAKKAKDMGDKIMKDMERNLAGSALAAAPSSGSGGFANVSSPAAALEEMKKDLSQQIKGYEGNSVPLAGGGAGKRGDDFSLDALSGNGGVTVADEQLAEAMNSEYDMGNSDINTDSGANIFNILSSRYQRSGMRRLFGGEALVPADQPASTDISK